MFPIDPTLLARRQIEIDHERTARYPHLFAHKVTRMLVSPHALFRGGAPLFYELIDRHPALGATGCPGQGWVVGDAHIENFGAYRAGALRLADTAAARAKEPTRFDLNDFDDALVGPWWIDVLRLATSLVLGAREAGANGVRTIELCQALIDMHGKCAFGQSKVPPAPHAVSTLVARVRARTRRQLLDARTVIQRGCRQFIRGPRYEEISAKLESKARKAFQKYVEGLPRAERFSPEASEVIDAAFRVAGVGSLGGLRIALLVRGKGGVDGAWIFDMKGEAAPAGACLVRPPKLDGADRVCTAMHACLARPPRMIGAARIRGTSMFVRRLAPQEDKVDLARVAPDDLEPLARHFGALLGSAHRRGRTASPKRSWTDAERSHLLERAVALAGLQEAMYLAYCKIVRR